MTQEALDALYKKAQNEDDLETASLLWDAYWRAFAVFNQQKEEENTR